MTSKALRVGVVGCGAISDVYIDNMQRRFSNLEVIACCAKHFESAQRKAQQYGLLATTFEDMLELRDIDMLVILTPAPTHYELIRRALQAGKHVYTEKMITLEKPQADELVRLADEKQLYLGSAPDTFLGAALQTARKAIDDGLIGEPNGFVASANRDLDNFAARCRFLRMPGGGICYDYGVYYLTALVSLLGPMARVSAVVGNRRPMRVNPIEESPDFGREFEYNNESYVNAILETRSGISGCLLLNGDTVLRDQAYFLIYGSKGMLKLCNPDCFGGDVYYLPNGDRDASFEMRKLPCEFPYGEDSRGVGPAEMADAIISGRPNRAAKEMACHVLDVIERIMDSAKNGRMVEIASECTRPEPMRRQDSDAWHVDG